MKSVSKFYAMAAVALSLGLSNCAKEDPAKPLEIDQTRTATIKGVVLINADITKAPADQKYSAAPIKATDFVVTIPYDAFNSGASGTYFLPKDKINYNASTGEFTITVPVGGNGTTDVSIVISDFLGTLKKNVSGTDKTVDVIWLASKNIHKRAPSVSPGQVVYVDDIKLTSIPAGAGATSDARDVAVDGSSI